MMYAQHVYVCSFFFFQAEDGIRDLTVTGVQTCALPILYPQNWLMYRGNYAGWGYSPLDQITTQNARKLTPVWTLGAGVAEGHESPPMVNNGVMFVSTPQNQVLALDAKNGDVLWYYKKDLPDDLLQLHPTNRGVGLYEDKVYLATVDAHLVALDAKTGRVVWDKVVEDYHKGL